MPEAESYMHHHAPLLVFAGAGRRRLQIFGRMGRLQEYVQQGLPLLDTGGQAEWQRGVIERGVIVDLASAACNVVSTNLAVHLRRDLAYVTACTQPELGHR